MKNARVNGEGSKLIPITLIAALLIFLSSSDISAGAGAAPGPAAILAGMEQAYAKVEDYKAIFLKKERVKGEVLPEETILFKFKKPFNVYMKWLPGPHKGREALYVRGKYNGKVIGHEGGFLSLITLRMDPEGATAMKGNRHPITDVGIGRLVEIITTNFGRARERGELKLDYLGEDDVYGRRAYHVLMELPPGKEKVYYAHKVEVWVDAELRLPIKVVIRGAKEEFLESYGYKDLRLNPGLSNEEFDQNYKEYGF